MAWLLLWLPLGSMLWHNLGMFLQPDQPLLAVVSMLEEDFNSFLAKALFML